MLGQKIYKMLVDFKSLNKNSRVWVFQSVTLIDDHIVKTIKEKLTLFLSDWKSHQNMGIRINIYEKREHKKPGIFVPHIF